MPELSPQQTAALHLAAAWMSERYFRTFRPLDDPGVFDAVLQQRDRRVGVTIGPLWEPPADGAPMEGADELAALLSADVEAGASSIEPGAYAVWVPPKATLPTTEPQLSNLRITLARSRLPRKLRCTSALKWGVSTRCTLGSVQVDSGVCHQSAGWCRQLPSPAR